MRLSIYTLLIGLLTGTFSIGQSHYDTIYSFEDYEEYIEQSCSSRKTIIQAVNSWQPETIQQLRRVRISIPNPYTSGILSTQYLTEREDILLQFGFGEYDRLLEDIQHDNSYFKPFQKLPKGTYSPLFECGNFAFETMAYWQSKTPSILKNIDASELQPDEKQLLHYYWKAILSYIEAKDQLPSSFTHEATAFIEAHPNSKYFTFAEKQSNTQKSYRKTAMTISLGFGQNYTLGDINPLLDRSFLGYLELGYDYEKWHFRLGYQMQTFSYQDSNRIDKIDNVMLDESTSINYEGITANISYDIWSNKRFTLQPFVSGEVNTMRNFIEDKEGEDKYQNGKTYANVCFGARGAFVLLKNLSLSDPEQDYYPREERDQSYDPLLLTLRVGYYPEVFKRPTGISGSVLYWALGVEFAFGKNKAVYNRKK